jgi:hypothetical protein
LHGGQINMNCQKEQELYDAALRNVADLRQALRDYTGSDKLYDGAPTGTWPEGTTAANRELAGIRSRLQSALEALPAARYALHRCHEGAGKHSTVAESRSAVSIGVLLEGSRDREWMRTILAHGANLDYVIEPDSAERFFDFLRHLAVKGQRIKFMVLMGHGSKAGGYIGSLDRNDVEIDVIRKRLARAHRDDEQARTTATALKRKLAGTTDAAKREQLSAELAIIQDDMEDAARRISRLREEIGTLEALAEVMDADAVIGLFSCHAAGSPLSRQMMRNLGKIFLEKRGGRITGYEGRILTVHNKPLIAWLSGAEDIVLFPLGKRHDYTVSARRCGVPCLDFERYGYCDNRARDGGPCWRHR